ncbi:MAG: hypothetical protein KA004_14300 [Verrucomicrobiales bacterium]|nr:hypothetical protein [Verrucomicrobiales bacterium]
MKQHLLSVFTGLALAGTLFLSPATLRAQDDKKEEKKEEKPAEEGKKNEEKKEGEDRELSDEEQEKLQAEQEAEELAKIKKMLEVFKSLEGEWVGEEKVEYNNDLPGQETKKAVTWKDEWKGFFSDAGRYFKMTGKTDGKIKSTYEWTVTYDADNEEYRAWSFGSNGWGEYTGELADDGKAVSWLKIREGDEIDIEDTFELRADGNKCSASGETLLVTKDGKKKVNYAKQSSSYTRRKIEI